LTNFFGKKYFDQFFGQKYFDHFLAKKLQNDDIDRRFEQQVEKRRIKRDGSDFSDVDPFNHPVSKRQLSFRFPEDPMFQVARFFLPQNIPKWQEIYQIAKKYTERSQNIPK
jgi:hypothetical protein